jgi:beta-galactosidase
MWNKVKYAPGELKAVAYKAGIKIGEKIIKTAGPPSKLILDPDRKIIKADGSDLSYILIQAIDEEGNLCPLATNKIQVKISGPGKIAGIGNGDPQSMISFKSHSVNLFYGKAMLIVGSDFKAGDLHVTAGTEGMKNEMVTIKIE